MTENLKKWQQTGVKSRKDEDEKNNQNLQLVANATRNTIASNPDKILRKKAKGRVEF